MLLSSGKTTPPCGTPQRPFAFNMIFSKCITSSSLIRFATLANSRSKAFARRCGYVIVEKLYDTAVSGADPIETRPGFAARLEQIAGNGVLILASDLLKFRLPKVPRSRGVLGRSRYQCRPQPPRRSWQSQSAQKTPVR